MPVLFLFFSLSVFLFMVVYAFSDESERYRMITAKADYVRDRNLTFEKVFDNATHTLRLDLEAQDKKTESTFRVVRRELETVLGKTEVLERTLTNMQLPKQRKRT
jgi:hypothetical protein